MLPFSEPRSTYVDASLYAFRSVPAGTVESKTWRSGPFDVRRSSNRRIREPSAICTTSARPELWRSRLVNEPLARVPGTAAGALAPAPGEAGALAAGPD